MIVELIRVLLVLLAVFLLIEVTKECRIGRVILYGAFILYLITLVYYTMLRGHRTGLGGFSLRFPFRFIKSLWTWHYGLSTNRSLLNLLLFVPFGYMFPQLFPRCNRTLQWRIALLVGFLSSLLIETAQFVFCCGVFELDDLVKNTFGAGVGWLIYYMLELYSRPQMRNDRC